MNVKIHTSTDKAAGKKKDRDIIEKKTFSLNQILVESKNKKNTYVIIIWNPAIIEYNHALNGSFLL